MVLDDRKMKKRKDLLVITILIITSSLALAQEESDIKKAADNATNPLAFVTKFQIQPNYAFKNGGGNQLIMVSRIMQPSKTIGLPFIKSKNPSKIYSIYRLEAPVASQTLPNSDLDATGLTDLILVDVIAFKTKYGIMGVGPAISLPTASSPNLGSGKWSAGLAGTFITKLLGLRVGVLAQQFVSFAGDSEREDQNYMVFQPFATKIFKKGYFMNISPIMKFDWENDAYNIPLGINVGKAFAKNLSVFIGTEYTVSGPNKGDVVLRLNINTMFSSL